MKENINRTATSIVTILETQKLLILLYRDDRLYRRGDESCGNLLNKKLLVVGTVCRPPNDNLDNILSFPDTYVDIPI